MITKLTKLPLLTVLSLGLAAGLSAENPKKYSIEEFLATTSYSGASFSPDNKKVLVSSDRSGIINAYAIPVGGGDPVQLTKSTKESVRGNSYFPNDERILYSADQGGNELNHVFVRELDGSVKDLTPGEKLKASFYGWSRDGKSFFVATNERDPRFFDLYRYATDGYGREMIMKNESGHNIGAISPGGEMVALVKTHTRDNSDLYLYTVKSKKLRHLTPHEGNINHSAQDFTPDGKGLLITTDRESDFRYLARLDLASNKIAEVKRYKWDIVYASYSWKGTYLVVMVNEDSSTDLHLFDAKTMKEMPLPKLANRDVGSVSLSHDEKHVAMYVSSGRQPSDLFYDNLGDEATPRQLTRSLSRKIDPDDLVDGKVVRFKSFDGVEIPGILYTPKQATAENKVPAIVWVHGGPGGQSRVGYRALIQYLVNHGYAVYAINNRGSTGYGNTFQQLDDRKHGEGDLDDCVTSKKMLISTGLIDPKRIGIVGGSYGGYMTLAALAFRPEEFEVGVDIFGVANWVRTLQSIPSWWESARKSLENEMGDFEDTDYLRSISPLFHAEKIKRPLLVLQGANDPRVLKVESDEMVAAVKKNKVPVEYIVFDDEGHGFRKKVNRIKGYKAIKEFLDRYLKGKK